MLTTILGLINYSILLVFGVYISAAILNIPFSKRNILILLAFTSFLGALQLGGYLSLGFKLVEKLYPLFIHFPIFLVCVLYFKNKPLPAAFSITSAYLFCQISKWCGIFAESIFHSVALNYATRIIITLFVGYLLIRYITKSINIILGKPTKTLLIFAILPFSYYIFDYVFGVYTNLLYSGSRVIFEFLPFVLCVAYIIFCIAYFKEYETAQEMEMQSRLVKMQTDQTIKEIQDLRNSQYEVSLIKHDMRHHLNNISALIHDNNLKDADHYIGSLMTSISDTNIQIFCKNKLVNLVISSANSKMQKEHIRLDLDAQVSADLPCNEMFFSTILANGLENAINAVSDLDSPERYISVKIFYKNDKLLLAIKNPYAKEPIFEDGLPINNAENHGYGTKSIRHLAEKLNGYCRFSVEDSLFVLQVVI